MTTAQKPFKPEVPNSEEFSRTLGQVAWLMTLSKDHRSKSISLIEHHVSAPLMFKQVRVYTKGAQPLAAVIWAYVSETVKQKILAGNHVMELSDWRSGPEVIVVDCISPLMDPSTFTTPFLAEVLDAQAKK